jgi:hypothetical protein
MSSPDPYLSVVVVSRNDDHGGDPLRRIQHLIDTLSEQCNRFHLAAELIIVEWNPPADKKSLGNVLDWPEPSSFFSVRIIAVPHEVHMQFPHADKIPLFQMIGKNVGIRRAHGDFVLATNIDVLFSNDLVQFISLQGLKYGKSYRVNRIDVEPDVPLNVPAESKIAFCKSHVIRINAKNAIFEIKDKKRFISGICKYPLLVGYRVFNRIFHHLPFLHYNACGDFTLIAKKHWFELRGYPEFPIFSMHIDSLFLIAVYYSGIVEEVLKSPLEIYHLEHALGSGASPGQGEKILFGRLKTQKVPYLVWADCFKYTEKMMNQRKQLQVPIVFNDVNWGLNDFNLKENKIL